MFEEIGHFVEKIRRVGYGPLILDQEPGKLRELDDRELAQLRKAADGTLRTPKTKDVRRRNLIDSGRLPTVASRPSSQKPYGAKSFDERPAAGPKDYQPKRAFGTGQTGRPEQTGDLRSLLAERRPAGRMTRRSADRPSARLALEPAENADRQSGHQTQVPAENAGQPRAMVRDRLAASHSAQSPTRTRVTRVELARAGHLRANSSGQSRTRASQTNQPSPLHSTGARRPRAASAADRRQTVPSRQGPGSDRPGSDRPGSDRPSSARPFEGKPSFGKPGGNRPGGNKPGGNKPAWDKSGPKDRSNFKGTPAPGRGAHFDDDDLGPVRPPNLHIEEIQGPDRARPP